MLKLKDEGSKEKRSHGRKRNKHIIRRHKKNLIRRTEGSERETTKKEETNKQTVTCVGIELKATTTLIDNDVKREKKDVEARVKSNQQNEQTEATSYEYNKIKEMSIREKKLSKSGSHLFIFSVASSVVFVFVTLLSSLPVLVQEEPGDSEERGGRHLGVLGPQHLLHLVDGQLSGRGREG